MYLGIKVCEKCGIVFTEHRQFVICPHDFRQEVDENQEGEIKRLFHKLWSRDVGTSGYSKYDWIELQRLLQARGINL